MALTKEEVLHMAASAVSLFRPRRWSTCVGSFPTSGTRENLAGG